MYVCIVSSMVCYRVCLLDSATNSTFFTRAEVALTNAADSSIAHTQWKEMKQIKEKAGTGSQTE